MPQDLFTIAQQQEIVAAIKQAEKNTSGEIRVHIEKNCKEDVLDHAAFIFDELEMQKTELRNGVLIYLAVEDRKLAILGDAGINLKVPKGFWDEIKELMITNFKEGKFTEGLSQGIILAGEQLKKHYPHDKENDENELSDEISFGGKL
ncbi:MAG: TPM domain-containing protein [Vicingaceae bacterium]|nr:TPM domain-containing protein [Vicingaceae bacterium]